MGKEAKILAYAQAQGEVCNYAEQVAETEAGTVYALDLVNENGMSLPTGLPRFAIEQKGKYTIVTGEEALKLLESLDLKE